MLDKHTPGPLSISYIYFVDVEIGIFVKYFNIFSQNQKAMRRAGRNPTDVEVTLSRFHLNLMKYHFKVTCQCRFDKLSKWINFSVVLLINKRWFSSLNTLRCWTLLTRLTTIAATLTSRWKKLAEMFGNLETVIFAWIFQGFCYMLSFRLKMFRSFAT